MKSNKIKDIAKNTSLESRLYVSNYAMFITMLYKLGFREDKSWMEEESKLLHNISELAKSHTKNQLKTIKKWNEDGKYKI